MSRTTNDGHLLYDNTHHRWQYYRYYSIQFDWFGFNSFGHDIFSRSLESSPVKLKSTVIPTVILPHMLSGFWPMPTKHEIIVVNKRHVKYGLLEAHSKEVQQRPLGLGTGQTFKPYPPISGEFACTGHFFPSIWLVSSLTILDFTKKISILQFFITLIGGNQFECRQCDQIKIAKCL